MLKRIFIFASLLAFCGNGFAKPKSTPKPKTVSKPSVSVKTKTAKSKPKSSCDDAYQKLFGKPIVTISVIFGYKDTRPARFVGDRHERLAFVQRILEPCIGKNQACDFTRSKENSDLFFKKVKDSNQNTVTVQLLVANSSVGSDDQANRTNLFQNWQSEYAKDAFFEGIKTTDIIFYNGHSRFGGGPDFDPPHLNDKSEVDSDYYQGQKPGFTKALDILQTQSFTEGADGGKLKILGLFSCGSSQHFTQEIQQYSGVGLISSRNLIYYSDALENSLAALSSVLQRRCQRDFDTSLHSKNKVKGMSIQGFLPKQN